MTFVNLQDRTMERLNLNTTAARDRVKDYLNQRYRQIQSSCGLAKTRFGEVSWTTASGSSTVTNTSVAKIFNVFDPTTLKRPLQECTVNDIRTWDSSEQTVGTPYAYAIEDHANDSITLRLYPQPDSVATLKSDALLAGSDMENDADVPTFPVDFHDALINGAMANEYDRMEKFEFSDRYEQKFQQRVSALRYFIAKSAYLHQQQTDMSSYWGLGTRAWPYSNLGG